MIISAFVGIDNFYFTDCIAVIKEKVAGLAYEEGERMFMGIKNKTIFIEDLGVDITFNADGDGMDTFELNRGSSASFEGINIFETRMNFLKEFFTKKDEHLDISDDGFLSKKFGIGIYTAAKEGKLENYPNTVVLYGRGHLQKAVPSEEDIINYYLNLGK